MNCLSKGVRTHTNIYIVPVIYNVQCTNLQIINSDMPSALVVPFPIIIQTVDLDTLKFNKEKISNITVATNGDINREKELCKTLP